MTKIRVAINGFGRIGRVFCRQMRLHDNLELVAINDLTNTHTLSHLLKYDSSQGHFPAPVSYTEKELIIDGKKVAVFSQENPELLPWDEMNIDVVVESTGRFTSRPDAERHLKAGARKVVISAPAQGDGDSIQYVVLGVNDHLINRNDRIISNASCTTNNVAPLINNQKYSYLYVYRKHIADEKMKYCVFER